MKLEYYLKINYIQLTLAFEVLDLFSRGFPDFIAERARLAPAAARGAFIPLQRAGNFGDNFWRVNWPTGGICE